MILAVRAAMGVRCFHHYPQDFLVVLAERVLAHESAHPVFLAVLAAEMAVTVAPVQQGLMLV